VTKFVGESNCEIADDEEKADEGEIEPVFVKETGDWDKKVAGGKESDGKPGEAKEKKGEDGTSGMLDEELIKRIDKS